MNRSVLRGIVLIVVAAAVVAALVLLPHKQPKKQHPPNDDPWVLVNYNPDDPYGTYLGNGFISTRIMGDGVGSQDGKPLPCYMAGFYDDEKLIPIPTWSDLRFYDGIVSGSRFEIDKAQPYRQTLNLKTGILTTHATWRHERRSLRGTVEIIVSRARPGVALVRARMVPDRDGLVCVEVPGQPQGQWVEGNAEREPRTKDWDVWTNTYKLRGSRAFVSVARCLVLGKRARRPPASDDPRQMDCIDAREGKRFEVLSYVGVGAGPDAASARHRSLTELEPALALGDRLVAEHRAAWADLWRGGITIDGPKKDQQVIHSCMFYLLSSVREGSKWSIPPMGLSNNAFGGHVFWDADIWMFPALILQHPDLAKSIVEYRYQTLPGALANAKADSMPGAQYAWESGYTGKEDTPEGLVYRHERHINGDVALAQWQYYLATGDLDWLETRGWPVIKATADWWVAKAKWVPAKSRYEILQVVPPDESADLINNSAYTNAIAKMNLEIATRAAKLVGQQPNPKWSEVAAKMYIPFDTKNRRFIAFDEYGSERFGPRYKAKQADTELLIYPLQFQVTGESMTDIYKNTFDYYAPRVHKGGPAMTASAHSVIAARLGDREKAYAEFLKSYRPFLRGPFNYFNEKPSKYIDNMCFLTGAAGPIQAVLFGIAGIRMDYFGDGPDVSGFGPANKPGQVDDPKSRNIVLADVSGFGSAHTPGIANDLKSRNIVFRPCLPKQWKSLKITGLKWRGKTLDLTVRPGNKVEITKK